MRKFSAIITGSTGMVGKAVLLECLDHPQVERVLVVNRRPLGMKHPKLREDVVEDFREVGHLQNSFADYDACFYCAGVSVLGKSEEEYRAITYDLTKIFAETCHAANPEMVFNYVSGDGTDSTEQGGTMWARVKGATENLILEMGFRDAYAFRPGAILPERGIKSSTGWYNAIYVVMRPFFPLLRRLDSIITTTQFGRAMIQSVLRGAEKKHLTNRDIARLAV